MKLLAIIVAEKLIIDSRTTLVTAVNLIEAISSVSFPYFIVNPFVMVTFHREEGDPKESEGELRFVMDDEEIARSSFIVDFGELPRTRNVLELNAIVVPRPGHLRLCISVAGEHRGDWDVLASRIVEDDEATAPDDVQDSTGNK